MASSRRSLWILLLPQVLALILLLNRADCHSSPANKTIHMGYILQYIYKERAGAINVAIEQAQEDGLLRDYNFRYGTTIGADITGTAG